MYRAAFIITLLLCGCGHGKEDKAKVKLVYVYRRDDAVRRCSSTVGQPKGAESRRERGERRMVERRKRKKRRKERERRKRGVEGGFAQLEQATTHNGGRQARGRDSNKRGGGCKKEHASERVVAPQWRNFRSSSCYDYDYIERYR